MSILNDLIRWVTGANGRTEEVKQQEEELVQRVKDETVVNMDRIQSSFRKMKKNFRDNAYETPGT